MSDNCEDIVGSMPKNKYVYFDQFCKLTELIKIKFSLMAIIYLDGGKLFIMADPVELCL